MADDTNTAEREALMNLADAYAEASFDQGLHQRTLDDAPEEARAKLEKALRNALAGRASLAASAGSEPVALEPRHIRKFLQALQAGEMSVARAVEILDAWLEGRYSDDMVPPPPADSCLIADDEFPMEIVRKLRSEMATHPSPPEGMAGESTPPSTRRGDSVMNAASNHLAALKAQRTSLDGFLALGNEIERAAWLDAQILELEGELEALAAPPTAQAEGWKPIETAPKGNPLTPGPRFLLFVKGMGPAFGHVYDDGCGGFFANADGYSGNWEITHWMPLPAPPLPASEAKEL